MIKLRADGTELGRLAKRLEAVLEVSKKPQLLLTQLAKGVIQQIHMRFDVEKEAPSGEPWAPWSADYADTRTGGDSLLIDSHDLRDSFTFKVSGRSFAVWPEDIEYAAAHQFGRPEINLPARPFMGFSKDNLAAIDDWLGSILLGGVKGASVAQTTRKPVKKGRRK